MDFDLAFLTEGMDVVLSARPNGDKSMLPEATVRISQMSLRGWVRMDTEVVSEWPYVGNGTCGFIGQPALDLSVSSFGGIDISIIPGLHSWLNMTTDLTLASFTAPNVVEVNWGAVLCPSCGEPPPKTAVELAQDAVGFIGACAVDVTLGLGQAVIETRARVLREGAAAASRVLRHVDLLRKRRRPDPNPNWALPKSPGLVDLPSSLTRKAELSPRTLDRGVDEATAGVDGWSMGGTFGFLWAWLLNAEPRILVDTQSLAKENRLSTGNTSFSEAASVTATRQRHGVRGRFQELLGEWRQEYCAAVVNGGLSADM
jgi:hypothetical protein